MASITIQNVDASVIEALEDAARRRGTTLEEEAHKLLVAGSAQLRHEEPEAKPTFMERMARWRAEVEALSLDFDDFVDDLEKNRDRTPARIVDFEG